MNKRDYIAETAIQMQTTVSIFDTPVAANAPLGEMTTRHQRRDRRRTRRARSSRF